MQLFFRLANWTLWVSPISYTNLLQIASDSKTVSWLPVTVHKAASWLSVTVHKAVSWLPVTVHKTVSGLPQFPVHQQSIFIVHRQGKKSKHCSHAMKDFTNEKPIWGSLLFLFCPPEAAIYLYFSHVTAPLTCPFWIFHETVHAKS